MPSVEAAPIPASPPSPPRAGLGRRWARRLLLAALLLAALGLFARGQLESYTNLDARLPELIRKVEEQTGLEIRVAGAGLALGFPTGIELRGIRATAPGKSHPLVEATALRMILRPRFLLRHRLVFDRIEVRSPVFRVERDGAGRFNFEEAFARFLTHRPGEEADVSQKSAGPAGDGGENRWITTVAVDSFRVRDGKVAFRDARASKPGLFVLYALDLEANRYPEAASLRFVLSASSRQDGGEPAKIEARGLLTNIYAAPSFSAIDVASHMAVRGLDLGRYLPSLVSTERVRNCRGILDVTADYRGSLVGPFTVETQARFTSLVLDVPSAWTAPLDAGDGTLRVRLEWKGSSIAFEDVALQTGAVSLTGRLALEELGGSDPVLALSVRAPLMNIPAIEPWFPLKILTAPFWPYITTVVDRGKAGIESFEGRGRLSQFSRIWEGKNVSVLEGKMLFEDVGGVPGQGFGRLDGLKGTLHLKDGTLHLLDFTGRYGTSRLDRIEGEVEKVYEHIPRMTLRIRGDTELADLRVAFAAPYLPPEVRAVADSLEIGRGRADLVARITTDFGALVDYDGSVTAHACDLTVKPWKLGISGLEGRVDVTRSKLSTPGLEGRVDGSQVKVSGEVAPYLENTTLALALSTQGISGGALYSLLGRPLPEGQTGGAVSGNVSVAGQVARPGSLGIEGNVDLADVPLDRGKGGETLEHVTGSVKIEATQMAFDLSRALYRGIPFKANGTYRKGGAADSLDLAVSSDSDVDLDAMLSAPGGAASRSPGGAEGEAKGGGEETRAFQVRGKLDLAKGRMAGIGFEGLSADLDYTPGSLSLGRIEGSAFGGAFAASGEVRLEGSKVAALAVSGKVTGADAKSVLENIGAQGEFMAGTADVSGTLRVQGLGKVERLGSLTGSLAFDFRDGTIRRSEVLWKVLDLVDFRSWIKRPFDFRLEGLHYSRINGTVFLSKGMARTDGIEITGDPVDLDVVGTLDVPEKQLRCIVAVKPFGLVDAVLDRIPVAGQLKNGLELTTYSFAVTGPLSDPTVLPAPLGKMDDFLKGLLGEEAPKPGGGSPAE